MTWKKAVKLSEEGCAVYLRGNYPYMRCSEHNCYLVTRNNFQIIRELPCKDLPNGGWKPLHYDMR